MDPGLIRGCLIHGFGGEAQPRRNSSPRSRAKDSSSPRSAFSLGPSSFRMEARSFLSRSRCRALRSRSS